jgi:hypothetical protein
MPETDEDTQEDVIEESLSALSALTPLKHVDNKDPQAVATHLAVMTVAIFQSYIDLQQGEAFLRSTAMSGVRIRDYESYDPSLTRPIPMSLTEYHKCVYDFRERLHGRGMYVKGFRIGRPCVYVHGRSAVVWITNGNVTGGSEPYEELSREVVSRFSWRYVQRKEKRWMWYKLDRIRGQAGRFTEGLLVENPDLKTISEWCAEIKPEVEACQRESCRVCRWETE